jgi:hypothetical protein
VPLTAVALVVIARGIHKNPQQLQQVVEARSGNYAILLFREIWTAVEPRLIQIPIDRSNLPLCVAFLNAFIDVQKQEQQKAISAQP